MMRTRVRRDPPLLPHQQIQQINPPPPFHERAKSRVECGKREALGEAARDLGVVYSDMARVSGFSTQSLHYHAHKTGQTRDWGGNRESELAKKRKRQIRAFLHLYLIRANGVITISELCLLLENDGYVSSSASVSRILSSWGWSKRIASIHGLRKFLPANVRYYGEFLAEIASIDPIRIHFVDEVTFSGRAKRKTRAWGKKGTVLVIYTNLGASTDTHMTLITRLLEEEDEDLFLTMEGFREETNDWSAFIRFIVYVLESGFVQPGDYIVIDGARIHTCTSSWAAICELSRRFRVQFVVQPSYSPELNVCEKVFAILKKIFSRLRCRGVNLKKAVSAILADLTLQTMRGFYYNCMFPIDV